MNHDQRAPRGIGLDGPKPATGPATHARALPRRARLAVAVVAAASLLGSCTVSAAVQTASTPASSPHIVASSESVQASALRPSESMAAGSQLARTGTLPSAGRLVASIAMPSPGSVETAFGSVWVANGPAHTLTRLNPLTNAVISSIPTPDPASAIAVGAGAIWLTSYPGNSLSRIDPENNRVIRTITLAPGVPAPSASPSSTASSGSPTTTVNRRPPSPRSTQPRCASST